jgi:uridine kinase
MRPKNWLILDDHMSDVALNALLSLVDKTERLVLVAIDGCGASGKSTLAARLASQAPASAVVHFDDFYRPLEDTQRRSLSAADGYEQFFDWQRLREQVLQPLRQGQPGRYERYDWPTGQLAEWHTVLPSGVVLVEGVYTTRPELRDLYDLTVFVETSREECLRRARARSENTDEDIERWRRSEDWYLANVGPADRADIVVPGGLTRKNGSHGASRSFEAEPDYMVW